MFQLIKPIKVIKQMHDLLIQNSASKKTNDPKLYINYQTDNKNSNSAQSYRLCNAQG